MDKTLAKVTCPKCSGQNELEVPDNACLQSYVCSSCDEKVTVPEDSENCCVVCDSLDGACPHPDNHKKITEK